MGLFDIPTSPTPSKTPSTGGSLFSLPKGKTSLADAVASLPIGPKEVAPVPQKKNLFQHIGDSITESVRSLKNSFGITKPMLFPVGEGLNPEQSASAQKYVTSKKDDGTPLKINLGDAANLISLYTLQEQDKKRGIAPKTNVDPETVKVAFDTLSNPVMGVAGGEDLIAKQISGNVSRATLEQLAREKNAQKISADLQTLFKVPKSSADEVAIPLSKAKTTKEVEDVLTGTQHQEDSLFAEAKDVTENPVKPTPKKEDIQAIAESITKPKEVSVKQNLFSLPKESSVKPISSISPELKAIADHASAITVKPTVKSEENNSSLTVHQGAKMLAAEAKNFKSADEFVKNNLTNFELSKGKLKVGDVLFDNSTTGVNGKQSDGFIRATNPDGKNIGHIDYTSYEEKTYINMIEVPKDMQGKGIAKMLLSQLERKFPENKLVWTFMSKDGEALKNSYEKSKSQLTDLYNKATGKEPSQIVEDTNVPTKSENPVFNERLSRVPLAERPYEEDRIKEYKGRLKLKGADPVLVDAIITPGGNRAYGVSVNGTLTFEKVVQAFTEDHEIFHQVFQNFDRMRLFKGFDRAELLDEAKALYGDLPDNKLEEEMASDFQQYVNDRESGKQTSFFGKIREFFDRLYASLKRMFKTESDIKEFYRTIYEERAGEETAIENTAPESFNTQQKEGVVDFRAADAAAEKFLEEVPAKEAFNDTGDLTLTTLKKLQGRTTVSKQFIEDLTNSGDIKQVERDLIRAVLTTEGDKVNVQEFADRVKAELLPLNVYKQVGKNSGKEYYPKRYENITLPDEIRGDVHNYREHVYESPIVTSAGDIHSFPTKNYFGHTRIEDMADDSTRRVIEVQSDLFQKGRIEGESFGDSDFALLDIEKRNRLNKLSQKFMDSTLSPEEFKEQEALQAEANALKGKSAQKLGQYNNPTAHFRMVREEIKQAAKDGKTALQFPTGETAMKIEGLGSQSNFGHVSGNGYIGGRDVLPNEVKVGLPIVDNGGTEWIITDVLSDGKFYAVPKIKYDQYYLEQLKPNNKWKVKNPYGNEQVFDTKEEAQSEVDELRSNYAENFDISGKVDTNNPIYRFYEKDLGRYLKNNYDAKPVTDAQGVNWYEVPVRPEMATQPVPAFNEKNPKFDSGDKLKDARDALAHVEKRVGAKSVNIPQLENMLKREEESLAAYNENPAMHEKAYGENRKPKYEAKIQEIQTRIRNVKDAEAEAIQKVRVSDRDVELPKDLQEKALAIELKRLDLQENPLSGLLKYVAKRGDYAGHLPPVEEGRSKFARLGEDMVGEILGPGENYTEDVRARMDDYLEERKTLASMEESFYEERAAFLREAKDQIALDRIGEANAGRVQKEMAKIAKEKLAAQKVRAVEEQKQKAILEEKAKKYGFTIPEYSENTPFANIPELIAYEDAIKRHPANPFMKYVNSRTGLLPEILPETPGVYGAEMKALLEKKGFDSVADAQKAVDNYLAQTALLDQMSEDKFRPIELLESESVIPTAVYQTEKAAQGIDGAKPLNDMAQESDEIPVKKKVGIVDFLRTPDRVLKKIGLDDEAILVKKKYNDYLTELPKNIEKIRDWAQRTPRPGASERIFDYLDGMPGEEGFDKVKMIYQEELKVADEIRSWLEDWARRLHLKPNEKIGNYITHIFEDDLIKKEFDQDLAKIIKDKVAGQVYDPFLEKRLGALGYVRDAYRAMDAYTKRATRKVHMDVALERLKIAAEKLDVDSWGYVKKYVDQVNLRPTSTDNLIDNSIKQMLGLKIFGGNSYRLGQRPLARISRAGRKMVFRGTLGLNIGSALKNITQGSNTFALLGPKYTTIGYSKLFNGLNHQELYEENILGQDIVQDKTISATKRFWEKTDKALFYLFETAEKINRGAAYFGAKAKYYAENSRMETLGTGNDAKKVQVWNTDASEVKARAYAKKIVEKTQFTFGSVDTPVALQSDIAKTLLQFQSFNVKQAEFLAEMAKSKNYAGMLRFVLATLAFMFTLGKLFGMKWQDAVPFSRYSLPPLIAGPYKLYQAIAGRPDSFGNVPSASTRLKNGTSAVIPFIPGGIQGQKTIKGLKSSSLSDSGLHRVRAGIFGPVKTGDSDKVVAAITKNAATAKTKADALDPKILNPAEDAWKEVKKLGVGTKEASAITAALSPEEYKAYQQVKAGDEAYQLSIAEKVIPKIQKIQELGFGSKEADKITAAMTKDEYSAYQTAKTALKDSISSDWAKMTTGEQIASVAKGWSVSPATAFDDLVHGDWKITQVKGGQIIVERAPQSATDAIKASTLQKNKNFKLDHTVPLEVGGTNRGSNLQILTTDQWASNTKTEDYLGSLLEKGRITGKQAREYIIRFKKGLKEPMSSELEKEYTEKYGGKPLTFDEIKSLTQ